MIGHTICPLCASGSISFYLKCTDHLLSKEEFELWKCSACGFVFTREHPDDQSISRYYESDDYISHDDRAKGLVNRIYIPARQIMLSRKRKIIEKASGLSKGKLLDIGCGTGHFAGAMKKSGWDLTGIEPNNKARDFCKQKFGINVIEPEKITELPTGIFDCITMWHVLEHFHDPLTYARKITRMLKKAGICLIALPNSNSFDAMYYREYWAAYDVPRHLLHFTPETFAVFAEKAGFRIKETRALPFDVFYISILSEKYRGRQFHFLKGILKGSLFAFRSLFNKSKSSSLIYILEQNPAESAV